MPAIITIIIQMGVDIVASDKIVAK
jgi:hypothetical protein